MADAHSLTRYFLTDLTSSSSSAVGLASGEDAFVGRNATIASETAYGIYGTNTSDHDVTVLGTVLGHLSGMYMAGSTNKVDLVKGAEVWGLNEAGIELSGNSDILSNAGYIFGATSGVKVLAGVNGASITNSGVIASDYSGVLNQTSGYLFFINSGTVSGDYAYRSGGLGQDFVTNTGRMTGLVDLGDNADSYFGASGHVARVRGGGGADTIQGGGDNEMFGGDEGNDSIVGGAGKDTLDGGNGIDIVSYFDRTTAVELTLKGTTDVSVKVGGIVEDHISGFENVRGSKGADKLTGDGLANTLLGNAGNDTLLGAGGNDTLRGEAGADRLDGGVGLDLADYNEKNAGIVVVLNGAAVVTVTVGGVAEDKISNIEAITGSNSADKITGDGLGNRLLGMGGNDVLFGMGGGDTIKGGGGKDTMDGGIGSGLDIADYSDRSPGNLVLTLKGATPSNVTVDGVIEDSIKNFEGAIGGTGNDKFTGDIGNNFFDGGLGKDTLLGGNGNDTLLGGFNNDTLTGGAGADHFRFSYTDLHSGGSSADLIADFVHGTDVIELDLVTTAVHLTDGMLMSNASGHANIGHAQYIYDRSSGEFWYDPNAGYISGTAVLVAVLSGSPDNFSGSDIWLV